jgi:DNA-binding transcriptional LysR family regulator
VSLRLEDIDYFLAVAEHGQSRRAADAVGVSQAAIVKGVQRLEAELGFPLFERGPRGMTLTSVSASFHQRVRTLRGSLGEAIKEAADLHLGAQGVLRVGVSPLYVRRLFVPACLQLHRQRPAARVRVAMNLNDALLAALRLGDVDLTINSLSGIDASALEVTPLMSDDVVIVARAGHPLLARRRLRLAQLGEAQWLLPGPGVALRRTLEGRLAEVGLPPPRVVVEVNAPSAPTIELLLHSDLLSVMSESTLAGPEGRGFAALPMAEARFARKVGIVRRRGVELPPLARRFVELLQEQQARSTASPRATS